jgi:hypothetical protein
MKKLIIIFIILLWGCTKPELPTPEVLSKDDIFSVTESSVLNGQSIHFNLPQQGTYILTLIDKETNQVISREKFIGQGGENIKKIYTNSLQTKYLYLTLEDINKQELARTIIIKK